MAAKRLPRIGTLGDPPPKDKQTGLDVVLSFLAIHQHNEAQNPPLILFSAGSDIESKRLYDECYSAFQKFLYHHKGQEFLNQYPNKKDLDAYIRIECSRRYRFWRNVVVQPQKTKNGLPQREEGAVLIDYPSSFPGRKKLKGLAGEKRVIPKSHNTNNIIHFLIVSLYFCFILYFHPFHAIDHRKQLLKN